MLLSLRKNYVFYNASGNAESKKILGIANGKYVIPDSIDECNDKIAKMFAVERL